MRRSADGKLAALAASAVGHGRSVRELQHLARLGDLATLRSGEVLQRRGTWMPWTYCVLDGTALVETSARPIAAVTSGAWLRRGRGRRGVARGAAGRD